MLSSFRFADDIVLIADGLRRTEVRFNELTQVTEEVESQTNKSNRTNIMTNVVIGGTIKLENNIMHEVTQYRYLGHEIDSLDLV